MAENLNSINKKNIINVSRNAPVALVVGAAGFMGSHLVDRLLDKGIVVIGIDNLSNGQKENLERAVKNKNFHLLIADAEDLNLEVLRLDYVFITAGEGWNLNKLLRFVKEKGAKCLFVSKIELYDEDSAKQFAWFKQSESRIARFASDEKLNARILRLGPVFGPGMNFGVKDPLVKLIQAALNNQLQKDVSLEFSTRALYVSDACTLLIKAMIAGSTAQKIFDGVLPTPIKVSEIKQILLDPVWYETKNFTPSELPPWPTPNLAKTMQVLNWYPKVNIVEQLKKTLSFFRDNEIRVPKVDQEEKMVAEEKKWQDEKSKDIEGFKKEVLEKGQKIKADRGFKFKFGLSRGRIAAAGITLLIFYALIFPVIEIGFGMVTFRRQLNSALNDLGKGEFEKSISSLEKAEKGVLGAKSVFDSFEPIRKTGQLESIFKLGDSLYNLASLSLSASRSTVLGTKALMGGVLAVTGESNEAPKSYFLFAQAQLTRAYEDLLKVGVHMQDPDFTGSIPAVLKPEVNSLAEKLALYLKLVEQGKAASVLLPEIVALDGNKNYLVLLQNNNELRPGGGFIGSFAKISFEGGKLKKVDVNDIYAIDGNLTIHVEPPKEIKEDLGQKDWYLRDSNWEADFPTSARQAEWFFTKETGEKVQGVVALDIVAMEKLLAAIGPLDLPDYNEEINADNLFERAITHAESSFFAGSQAKKNFLTALTHALFNKIFFLPNPNWPGVVKALGDSLEEKHMSIFLDDPKLFSYLVAQNWAGILPREDQTDDGIFDDFIAPVEANLGANKSNYYLERNYNLETVVGKEGEIRHRLRINYINKSPSDSWPAGVYKNRFRIYLPFGSSLSRVLWGESNITSEVSAFVDYGRTAFSMLLKVNPKEQKILVIDYQVPGRLEFKDQHATYKLNVVKQAGTLRDPFIWNLTYPLNYRVVFDKPVLDQQAWEKSLELAPQEQTIQTDLSKDRSFLVEFEKN